MEKYTGRLLGTVHSFGSLVDHDQILFYLSVLNNLELAGSIVSFFFFVLFACYCFEFCVFDVSMPVSKHLPFFTLYPFVALFYSRNWRWIEDVYRVEGWGMVGRGWGMNVNRCVYYGSWCSRQYLI